MDPNWTRLERRLKNGRTYDIADDSIDKNEVVAILRADGYPFAEDIQRNWRAHRLSVKKCLEYFSHMYSYASFDEDPQPDFYTPRKEVMSPTRPHRHARYQHYDAESTEEEAWSTHLMRADRKDTKDRLPPHLEDSLDDLRYSYGGPMLTTSGRTGRNNDSSCNYKHGNGPSKRAPLSDRARSRHDENSDEEFDLYSPPVLPTHSALRRTCKQCKKMQQQNEQLEKEVESLRNSVSRHRRELSKKSDKINEYKMEIERLRYHGKVDSESSDHLISDYQFDKMKRNYGDKIHRLELAFQERNRDYNSLHEEWTRQKRQIRELETRNYQKDMEVERLEVECTAATIKANSQKRYTDQRRNKPKPLRQGAEDSMQPLPVGVPMQRTKSDGIVPDVGTEADSENIKGKGVYSRQKAKSLKSLRSDDSDGPHFFPAATSSEARNVFKVLNEDVAKSVFSESLPEQFRLGIIRSLSHCHTQEEVIRTLLSYGCVPHGSDRYQQLDMEYQLLKNSYDHLKVQQSTLSRAFDDLKKSMEELYIQANMHQSNEVILKLALTYCQKVVDMLDLLNELRHAHLDRTSTNLTSNFPIDTTSSRSYLVSRARHYLSELDNDEEFQTFVTSKPEELTSSSISISWSHELSQNTTSGVSSVTSSSIDGELTSDEMYQLKQYSRLIFAYQKRMQQSLKHLNGLKGLDIVRQPSTSPDPPNTTGTSEIAVLEEEINLEELQNVREEKAELRSRIYMMEQEKKKIDLEISRRDLDLLQHEKQITLLETQITEERKRRKRRDRKSEEGSYPPEMEEVQEREEALQIQYDELYLFLKDHIRKSKINHEKCMDFIKDLNRANHALVVAYEKSMKQQKMEKKQMREELKAHMSRVREAEDTSYQPGETHL